VFNVKFFPTAYQTKQFEKIVEAWEQAWRDEYYIKPTTEDGREVEVINNESPFLQACADNVVTNPEAGAELEQTFKIIKASLTRLSELLVLLMNPSMPIQTLANLARPLVFMAESWLVLARRVYIAVLNETWANVFPGQERVLVLVAEAQNYFPMKVANFLLQVNFVTGQKNAMIQGANRMFVEYLEPEKSTNTRLGPINNGFYRKEL